MNSTITTRIPIHNAVDWLHQDEPSIGSNEPRPSTADRMPLAGVNTESDNRNVPPIQATTGIHLKYLRVNANTANIPPSP